MQIVVAPDSEALDVAFRFFNEWLEHSGPEGVGPVASRATASAEKGTIFICCTLMYGFGGFSAETRSGFNIRWQHDLREWSESRRDDAPPPKFEGERRASWEDVDFPTSEKLAGAAAAFMTMSVDEADARLADGWGASLSGVEQRPGSRVLSVCRVFS